MVRDTIWLKMALYVLIFDRDPIGLDRILTRRTRDG